MGLGLLVFVDMQGSSGDMVALTVLLMQQHQGNDGVVTAGMELLGALAYNLAQAGYEPHPKLAVCQQEHILRDASRF